MCLSNYIPLKLLGIVYDLYHGISVALTTLIHGPLDNAVVEALYIFLVTNGWHDSNQILAYPNKAIPQTYTAH